VQNRAIGHSLVPYEEEETLKLMNRSELKERLKEEVIVNNDNLNERLDI
jgi:hypothetical protein